MTGLCLDDKDNTALYSQHSLLPANLLHHIVEGWLYVNTVMLGFSTCGTLTLRGKHNLSGGTLQAFFYLTYMPVNLKMGSRRYKNVYFCYKSGLERIPWKVVLTPEERVQWLKKVEKNPCCKVWWEIFHLLHYPTTPYRFCLSIPEFGMVDSVYPGVDAGYHLGCHSRDHANTWCQNVPVLNKTIYYSFTQNIIYSNLFS